MTTAPSARRATAALERCVGDVRRFEAEFWGRRALHHRSAQPFDDLMSFEDVDHIISTMSLRLPMFRVVKDGATIPVGRYTKRGRTGSQPITGLADPAGVVSLFADGATIVLQGMHRYWPPLAALCRDLEITLGHRTQVNAYITPPGAAGLAVHEDAHDVFVLQAFGSKHWDVYERRGRATESGSGGGPVLSVDLRPGEGLYLPKRTPHAARTQGTLSGHITVGVVATTWGDVLAGVVDRLRHEPQFDEPLPAGFHRDGAAFAAALAARLEEVGRWLDKTDPAEVAAETVRRFLSSRPPLLKGLLLDVSRLGEIDDATTIARRPGSVCELWRSGARLHVLLGDRELAMPARLEPALERIRRSDRMRVGDLSAEVADAPSRAVLVRRLVREGLLEVIE
ncbi:MAG: cupin domain-containing protein [Actinomycetota bacterium]